MLAIERNEEYFPEFKACMNETMTKWLEMKDNSKHYGIAEDKIEEAVEKGCDQIKLSEIKEVDLTVYATHLEEMQAKWGGASGEEE